MELKSTNTANLNCLITLACNFTEDELKSNFAVAETGFTYQ